MSARKSKSTTSKPIEARKPATKDPRAIARTAADEYFAALLNNPDLGEAFDEMASPLDGALEEIINLLEAEHVKQHGPITSDADVTYEMIGRETGYLVGVQVGLRLRGDRR